MVLIDLGTKRTLYDSDNINLNHYEVNLADNYLEIFNVTLPETIYRLSIYSNNLIVFKATLSPNLKILCMGSNNIKKLKLNRVPRTYFDCDFKRIKNKKIF